MKGNYQQQEAIMKFSPQVGASSRVYQTQQYKKSAVDSLPAEKSNNYAVVPVAVLAAK